METSLPGSTFSNVTMQMLICPERGHMHMMYTLTFKTILKHIIAKQCYK